MSALQDLGIMHAFNEAGHKDYKFMLTLFRN